MATIEFEIFTKPMSVNRYYSTTRGGGIHITTQGKNYRDGIRGGIEALGTDFTKLDGQLQLDIKLKYNRNRKLDVDNCLKPLLDSLEGYLYSDDSQIFKLTICKSFGNSEESIVINAEPYVEAKKTLTLTPTQK